MRVFLAGLALHWVVSVSSSRVADNVPCANKTSCQQVLGHYSYCNSGNCTCDDYYYQGDGATSNCVQCPGIGESCSESKCCSADYLVCHSGVCMCGYNDYCWNVNEEERERFQRVAQCILAVALILTATILFILFWKACSRRSVVRRHLRNMSADSFLSLNSIQRLVLLQLQDRPPPYNPELMQNWKNINEITEPPPSYFEAVGVAEQSQGEDNYIFILDDTNRRLSTNRALVPLQSRPQLAISSSESQAPKSECHTTTSESCTSTSVVSTLASTQNISLGNGGIQNSPEVSSDTLVVVATNAELHI